MEKNRPDANDSNRSAAAATQAGRRPVGRPAGKKQVWPNRRIRAVKEQVKKDIDAQRERLGDAGQDQRQLTRYLLGKVRDYSRDLDPDRQLHCYTYIVSALVHTSRWGTLDERQIHDLYEHALGLLRVVGISSEAPRTAHLYGDLYQIMSQISRKFGSHWRSLWEQQLAARKAKADPERSGAFQSLGLAIRALRLGQAPLALEQYRLAAAIGPDAPRYLQARLGLIKTLRLSGKFEEAQREIQETAVDHPELVWEEYCLHIPQQVQKTSRSEADLSRLIALTKKGRSHHEGIYILEALLWARAHPATRWADYFPKVATLKRKPALRIRRLGMIAEAVEILERCYDYDYPLDHRLQMVGEIMSRKHEFLSIDHELLFCAAAARWLFRSHAVELGALVVGEYRRLSRQLSGGAVDDIFQTCLDIPEL